MTKDEQYELIFNEAKNDPDVIGLVLTGGRGKGFVTDNSDYDICIVVSNRKFEAAKEKYKSTITPHKFDISVHTLETFKQYASWGSEFSWDRYNYAYLKALIDKTGEFQKLIDEKGVIPADKIKEYCASSLDDYINFYYRMIKNHRDGYDLAFLLASTESVAPLLTFVFSQEGRLRPYNKYLEWELEKNPLKFLPWGKEEFIAIIRKILETRDVETQKEIFRKICQLAIDRGYGETIDSWKGCYFG